MIYAVKLAEQHGERIVIGAIGPVEPIVLVGRRLCTLAYDNYWLARVLDEHQDEYEEVTL